MRLPVIATVLVSLSATGCFIPSGHQDGDGGYGNGGGGGSPVVVLDAPERLGLEAMLGYHVRANASAGLPDGDLGFIVTANGQGGYRLSWSDTLASTAHFSGSAHTDGVFDLRQLQGATGYENLTVSSDNSTVYFDSVPGASLDGVDLVPSNDPLYLDLEVNGSHQGFSIYFTGADSGQLLTSAYDPVAVTSP
jgi:hypothetical protein